jgi:cobalt-zinc-cadmium efflux system outer membrane protein
VFHHGFMFLQVNEFEWMGNDPGGKAFFGTMNGVVQKLIGLSLPLLFLGCQMGPKIDVQSATTRASGISDAILIPLDDFKSPDLEAGGVKPQKLTLLKAVRRALLSDPRIGSALAHVRMAEADANQSRLIPNPILGFDIRFPVSGGLATAMEPTLSEDIVAILEKPGQISAADNRLRESAEEALTTILDVIAEVQQSYVSAYADDAQIANALARQKIVQQLRDLAQNRLQSGEGSRLDVMTLDAQLIEQNLEVDDLRLQSHQERLTLARLIDSSSTDWMLEGFEESPELSSDETAWINAALNNRPEIQAKTWELRALGDDIKTAWWMPFQGDALGVHAEHDGGWRVGPTVVVPLPIFDFGQAGRKKAEAARLAGMFDLAQQQRTAVDEIRQAYAGYDAARKSLDVAQNQLLPLHEEVRHQAQLAYQAGEADLTTLLSAETDLQQTYTTVVELQQKMASALIRLRRAAGGAAIAATLESPSTRPTTLPTTRNARP